MFVSNDELGPGLEWDSVDLDEAFERLFAGVALPDTCTSVGRRPSALAQAPALPRPSTEVGHQTMMFFRDVPAQ